MKINPIQQNDAVAKYASSANSAQVRNTANNQIADSVELSDGAQKFASLMKAARESLEKSGSDEEARASDIIAQMNEDSYNVSAGDVVSGIMSGFPTHI